MGGGGLVKLLQPVQMPGQMFLVQEAQNRSSKYRQGSQCRTSWRRVLQDDAFQAQPGPLAGGTT